MTLEFKVESQDGATSLTSNDIAQAFQAQGFQQATLSPDGQTIHLVDASGGTAELNVPEFVGGKSKVLSMTPVEGLVDTSMVDPGLRASIGALGNHNDLKQLYLQGQLREKGFKDAKVVGSGDDFYFFNPETGKYSALTNKPGFDFSDAAGFIPKAAETVLGIGGSIAGGLGLGAIGAATGTGLLPGAGTVAGGIAGGSLGSAIGGATGRQMFDSAAQLLNPDLMPYMNSEEFMSGRNREAVFDAAGGALGGVGSAFLPKLMSKGVASTALSKAGGAVEKTGDIIGKGAAYLGSEEALPRIARGISEGFVPITGQAQIPALIARSGELIPAGLKGLNKAASWAYGRLGNAANLAEETAGQQTAKNLAEWSALKGLVREKTPEWGAKFASYVKGADAPTAGVREAGIKDALSNLTANTRLSNIAPGVGDALELASKAGRTVEGFNAAAVKAPIKALEYGAKEAALAGNVAKNLGRAAAPLENQALLRQGGNWASEESQGAWDRMLGRKPKRQQTGY